MLCFIPIEQCNVHEHVAYVTVCHLNIFAIGTPFVFVLINLIGIPIYFNGDYIGNFLSCSWVVIINFWHLDSKLSTGIFWKLCRLNFNFQQNFIIIFTQMITLISKLEGVDKNKHLPAKTCHVWGRLKMKFM